MSQMSLRTLSPPSSSSVAMRVFNSRTDIVNIGSMYAFFTEFSTSLTVGKVHRPSHGIVELFTVNHNVLTFVGRSLGSEDQV